MATKKIQALSDSTFFELESAMADESLDWLRREAPDLAGAVETATKAGATPEEIFLKVIHTLGTHRGAIAKRCQLAAQALRN